MSEHGRLAARSEYCHLLKGTAKVPPIVRDQYGRVPRPLGRAVAPSEFNSFNQLCARFWRELVGRAPTRPSLVVKREKA